MKLMYEEGRIQLIHRKKQRVLVVDDEETFRDMLSGMLGDEYDISAATNGKYALKLVERIKPDIILLDIIMSGELDGYGVLASLQKNPKTKDIPVMFLTGKIGPREEERGLKEGAVDYITKPFSRGVVLARLKTHLELVRKDTSQVETLLALLRVSSYKDRATSNHTLRVGLISYLLALEMGIDVQTAFLIFLGGPLHDIGKVAVEDKYLNFPGNLREDLEGWAKMEGHTTCGADIIGRNNLNSPLMQMIYNIVLFHHEKLDGSGYPNQKRGTDIPLEALIVAVADFIDATLGSKRVYHTEVFSEKRVRELLTLDRGVKLPVEVVDAAFVIWENIMLMEEIFSSDRSVPFEKFAHLDAEVFFQLMQKILRDRRYEDV